MARIWLNHWFSTAYNIIRLIRGTERRLDLTGGRRKHDEEDFTDP